MAAVFGNAERLGALRIEDSKDLVAIPSMSHARASADFLDNSMSRKSPEQVAGARLAESELLLHIANGEYRRSEE